MNTSNIEHYSQKEDQQDKKTTQTTKNMSNKHSTKNRR